MSAALSTTLHADILAWIKGTAMPTAPSALRLGLLTAAPHADGTGVTEPNGANGYARQPVILGPVSVNSGISSVSNTNAIVFGPATSAWPTVTHAAVFNLDDGEMLWFGPLPASRTAPSGDSISFGAGALQLRIK